MRHPAAADRPPHAAPRAEGTPRRARCPPARHVLVWAEEPPARHVLVWAEEACLPIAPQCTPASTSAAAQQEHEQVRLRWRVGARRVAMHGQAPAQAHAGMDMQSHACRRPLTRNPAMAVGNPSMS